MKSVVTGTAIALNIATSLIGHEEVQSIDARELHEQLQSKQRFGDWIRNRLETYGFVDGEDFIINLGKTSKLGGRPKKDYILTLDTAKEIAMVENNEQGRKIRKYLIQIEKEYREGRIGNPATPITPDNITQILTDFTRNYADCISDAKVYMPMLMAPYAIFARQQDAINDLKEQIQALEKERKEEHPADLLARAMRVALGREVQLSLGPTTGIDLDHTHTTIKGFCAEHKIKLAHGDSIRFANTLKHLCKKAGEKIQKIPDARYGSLNIYPRYLLVDAVKFL